MMRHSLHLEFIREPSLVSQWGSRSCRSPRISFSRDCSLLDLLSRPEFYYFPPFLVWIYYDWRKFIIFRVFRRGFITTRGLISISGPFLE
jgi:hypothetical protein